MNPVAVYFPEVLEIETSMTELDNKPDRTRIHESILWTFQEARDKMLQHSEMMNGTYTIILTLKPRLSRNIWKDKLTGLHHPETDEEIASRF